MSDYGVAGRGPVLRDNVVADEAKPKTNGGFYLRQTHVDSASDHIRDGSRERESFLDRKLRFSYPESDVALVLPN